MISAFWIESNNPDFNKAQAMIQEDVSKNSLYVTAYMDNNLAAIGVLDLDSIDKESAMIGPVIVSEPYRRNGIGNLVMRMLIRRAFNLGYESQFIFAELELKSFLESVGFTKTEIKVAGKCKFMRYGDIAGVCD